MLNIAGHLSVQCPMLMTGLYINRICVKPAGKPTPMFYGIYAASKMRLFAPNSLPSPELYPRILLEDFRPPDQLCPPYFQTLATPLKTVINVVASLQL